MEADTATLIHAGAAMLITFPLFTDGVPRPLNWMDEFCVANGIMQAWLITAVYHAPIHPLSALSWAITAIAFTWRLALAESPVKVVLSVIKIFVFGYAFFVYVLATHTCMDSHSRSLGHCLVWPFGG